LNQIITLFKKEIALEWRQRYAVGGMLLYVISTIYIVYLGFNLNKKLLTPIVWNTLFWIILLFTAVSAIAKSFTQERQGRLLYFYTIASPQAIIVSKILYNVLLMLLLSAVGFAFYSLMLGNPVADLPLYLTGLALGAVGFASVLTMVASIAAKAENSGTLMAVLSFPVIVPMLLMVIRLSKNALDGLDRSVSYDEIITLLAIDAIVVALSTLLFPYLWRS
jgi:heme exporter protein B